jgi:hypothetical protein
MMKTPVGCSSAGSITYCCFLIAIVCCPLSTATGLLRGGLELQYQAEEEGALSLSLSRQLELEQTGAGQALAARRRRLTNEDDESNEEPPLSGDQLPLPTHFFSLKDPRLSEQSTANTSSDPQQPQQHHGNFQLPDGFLESDATFKSALTDADQIPRPLNILAFGTSQTWGHQLKDHRYAYPFLILPPPPTSTTGEHVEHVIDNLALPATAADHPSLCFESMMPDAFTKNYDLILFEYPSAQSDGVRLLLLRLRERYPEAVIMFVHVWHIVGRAVAFLENTDVGGGNGKPKRTTPSWSHFDKSLPWVWREGYAGEKRVDSFSQFPTCFREVCMLDEMRSLLEEVNGVSYLLDQTISPQQVLEKKWFGDDWHHLTQEGHKQVAMGIADTLRNDPKLWAQAFKDDKPLGSFGTKNGDQCFNWYFSGDITNVEYAGAELKCASTREMACTLDIDPSSGAIINFQSDFAHPVPVALAYMTQGSPAHTYPTNTVVQLNADENPVVIHPALDRMTRFDPTSSSKIMSYTEIGLAPPGRNTLRLYSHDVDPTATTPPQRPFELVGIYLCAACQHFQNGHMGIGALTEDNLGTEQHYNKTLLMEAMGYPVLTLP